MFESTDDLRINQLKPLIPPAILMEELPISEEASHTVAAARRALDAILAGEDDRLVVVSARVRSTIPKLRSNTQNGSRKKLRP